MALSSIMQQLLCLSLLQVAVAFSGSAVSSGGSDYENVGMQCVSEFNWNQGEGDTYKSATGYFLGKGASIVTNKIPDCAGGWSAHDDTPVLKEDNIPF